MKKVGVIGGSGFIGSYITQQFLNNNFEVKVSATDIAKEEKYLHLLKFDHSENLYISELNIENKEALIDFVNGCDIVIHGGTPFQLEVQDVQAELIEPTVNGTHNFLQVVSKTTSIEKVVLIASVAVFNTNFPLPPNGKKPTDAVSEKDLPFIGEDAHPYALAKFLANQAVNQFIADNSHLDVEISSVSPVGVMGKSLSGRQDSTSGNLQYLFKNKIAPNPFVQMLFDNDVAFALVDVSDVAEAVFKAATTMGLHGKNYLLSSETYRVSDMNRMLNQLEPINNPTIVYQNDLAKADLGMVFKPIKQTLNNYSK